MGPRTLAAIFCCFSASALAQANAHEDAVHRLAGHSLLDLQWYAPNIVRVRISPGPAFSLRPSLSVVASPADAGYSLRSAGDTLIAASQRFVVRLDTARGTLRFLDPSGSALLTASGPDSMSFSPDSDAGDHFYRLKQRFLLSANEAIYGLGQFEDPIVNERGHDIRIAQSNRTAVNPFLVSTRGYGILWDNASASRFSDGAGGTVFESEAGDQIDYYVVYGPSLDSVIAGYRLLTGASPLFGKWAYGYWQSKERYKTSSELIGVVKEYRRRNIPLDNIVQDWAYWGDMDHFSGMIWDSTTYPDPKGMTDSLHALHAHLMVSIWPAFGTSTAIYKEMNSAGMLYSVRHWNNGRVYDAYNPLARDLYWRFIKKGLYDAGVDAYWMDATEPEFRCSDDRYITELSMKNAGRNFLGSFARYLNTYSLMTTKAVYENLRRETDAHRAFILTRSAFSGQQRYGAATWSGDTFATWDDLKVQVAAGISFSMSGIPYWTNDIGGFITDVHFPRGLSDPAYKELYVRWFQFGAFCPIFRAHGTTIPREIWQFGKPGEWAYRALVAADRLRYRLLPYIYSVAGKVTRDGYSFIRALAASFPEDTRVYSIASQFLFGPSLMVCPVTRPMLHTPDFKGVDITPDHWYSPDGTEHGMDLAIYAGVSFDSLVLKRKTDASQIGWAGCLPEGLNSPYSVRMTGRLMSGVAGKRRVYVMTDGGVRLWLGNTLVMDHWNDSVAAAYSAEVDFKAAIKYPITLEHRQFRPNTARLKINWEMIDASPRGDATVDVYLPAGPVWYDFWSGDTLRGGNQVRVNAPVERIPLFVPSGSIIPIGPPLQFAEEHSAMPVELRIYPGRDADFEMYDDDGETYAYEEGACERIPIHWDDARRTLTFGTLRGGFPGAPLMRSFTVVLVRNLHGAGSSSTPGPEARVNYSGTEVTIRL